MFACLLFLRPYAVPNNPSINLKMLLGPTIYYFNICCMILTRYRSVWEDVQRDVQMDVLEGLIKAFKGLSQALQGLNKALEGFLEALEDITEAFQA